MNRERCSVTIITLNEERHLPACLKSVQWADEIVMVDSGSSDRTVEVGREFGCKIFVNPWPGMREQKNLASERAAGPWILNIDADERVPGELQQRIEAVLRNAEHTGYRFPRKNYFLGKWMRHGGWYPDATLRLFRKDQGRFEGVNPHAKVVLSSSSSGDIDIPLEHHTYTSFAQYIAKQYPYADAAAREALSTGKIGPVSAGRIAGKTVWKFLETFVLKRGFLDGPHGLVAALGATFAAYMKQARLWELSGGTNSSLEDRP